MTSHKGTATEWNRSKTVVENARERLPELARQFLEAGRIAAAPDAPMAVLHPFRLITKRFRYTVEFFEGCYGTGLKHRIEALRHLQDFLGAISDCFSTQELLGKRDDLPESERARLQLRLKKLAETRIAAFRRNWKKEFSPPARERWWVGYLRQAKKQK